MSVFRPDGIHEVRPLFLRQRERMRACGRAAKVDVVKFFTAWYERGGHEIINKADGASCVLIQQLI